MVTLTFGFITRAVKQALEKIALTRIRKKRRMGWVDDNRYEATLAY